MLFQKLSRLKASVLDYHVVLLDLISFAFVHNFETNFVELYCVSITSDAL